MTAAVPFIENPDADSGNGKVREFDQQHSFFPPSTRGISRWDKNMRK